MSTRDCSRTTHAAAAFLAGELPASELADLRAHRAHCEACDATWRRSLSAAAAMQHRGRTRRLREEREARREEQRSRARAGMTSAGAARTRRRAHLRLIALPTLAVVLMTVIHPLGGARRARLEVLAGEVELDARTLAGAGDPVYLARGDQCATGVGGRARIACRVGEVELGEATRVLVEDEAQGRFRLDAGALRVAGDCTVTSRFGLVEVRAGRAELRVLPEGLELASLAGRVTAVDSLGERPVPPGERALMGPR